MRDREAQGERQRGTGRETERHRERDREAQGERQRGTMFSTSKRKPVQKCF